MRSFRRAAAAPGGRAGRAADPAVDPRPTRTAIARRAAAPPGGRGVASPGRRLRPLRAALCLALLTAAAGGVPATGPPSDDEDAASAYRHAESLTVTDTRLRDDPRETLRVPAHVTVLTRRDIEASGARTLQELLAREAGVVLYDQVGDGVSRTLDLRGFAAGTGIRVFLDGAPLNDPRSNAVALELVPLEHLERVEITRGSTAALAGGGAEAGTINLWSRPGGEPGGSVALAAGGFGTVEASGEARGAVGRTRVAATGFWHETDGFRDNGGGELGRLSASAARDLAGGRRLTLTAVAAASDFGNPGALTPDELARDREAAPFNRLDFGRHDLAQASLNLDGPLGRHLALAANVFVRDRDEEILSTGRAAPLFGGFFLDSRSSVAGATAQLAARPGRDGRHELTGGVEWLDGETSARGFFTSPADPGLVDRSAPASDNVAERQTLGLFLQERWTPAEAWTVSAGLRLDRDEVGYREARPDPSNAAGRTFEELSLRAGVSWTASPRTAVYVSYGEGFLPPTVEQLFSFPLFGSNPDLEPEDSRSLEAGFKLRGTVELDVSLFRIDTEDAIVFDPGSSRGLFGANENAGRARRSGLEVSGRGRPHQRLSIHGAVTLLDAELRSGPDRGRRLPLVPEERLALGIDLELPAGLRLSADGLWVGSQVLDNDEPNLRPELDGYTVIDARLAWAPAPAGGLTLFVEARNLLDEEYATRGIFAFDFAAGADQVFLTPAPGRRLLAGLEWDL